MSATSVRPFLSVSRRTDIPAWYSDWLMARLAAGWCVVANPFRPSQRHRVELDPTQVEGIFFWTRWFSPMLPHIAPMEDAGWRFVVQYTLTGLPRQLEPHPVEEARRLEGLEKLAGLIGAARVWWRYDPIVLGRELDAQWHLRNFARLAARLEGRVTRVTLSLLDWYRKTERQLATVAGGGWDRAAGGEPRVLDLVQQLAAIARRHAIEPVSCCEPPWEQAGIRAAPCIDAAAFNGIFATCVKAQRDKGQRRDCLCAPAWDIGRADTCPAGCLYCYATRSHSAAALAFRCHGESADRESL